MLSEIIYRRFTQLKSLAKGMDGIRGTGMESVAVGQVEPTGFERTRAGLCFDIGFLAVTGIAPVQAIPTTAAQWLIYNPTQKAMAFDEIGMVLVSGTAGAGILVLGALVGQGTLPATLPTGNSANIFPATRSDGAGAPTKSSGAIIVASQTLANSPNRGWRVLAKSDTTNTAILSVAAINAELNGELIIRPGQGLALCTLSPAGTTPLYAPHGVWTELDTDIE